MKIDVEDLRKVISYFPCSGRFFWKVRSIDYFKTEKDMNTWNTRFSGKETMLQIHNNGYMCGRVFGKNVYAHRAAFAIIKGFWPNEIDHINGNKTDNRIENLRDVSHSQNHMNMPVRRGSISGQPGVSKCKNRWYVRIMTPDGDKKIGIFDDLVDAIKARKDAEIEYGYHENHGRTQ